MKPHSVEDWKLALDAIEWFQQQLRAKSPEEVRAWISPSPPQDDIVAGKLTQKESALLFMLEKQREYEGKGLYQTAGLYETAAAAIAALGEKGWQPWNPNLPLPADGKYVTTVCGRGYRGPFVSFTETHRFKENDVLAYWSSPLPKPYSPSPPIGAS